jgi:streptogramin lyase
LVAVWLGVLLLASAAGAAAPTITEYHAGITAGSIPRGIAAGPDGNLWFTEENANRIGKITPAGVVTEYRVGSTANSNPYGIAGGPDGNLWFTEVAGRIGKITPAGVATEYHAGPTADAGFAAGAGTVLEEIAAGPDGNLWFTEFAGSRIAKITQAGVATEYRAGISAGSGPVGIAAGPDGNLWFTEANGNRIGRLVVHATAPTPEVSVTVTVKGKGRITGGGISCPARCKATIASGTNLTLRARTARGYRFAVWSGACAGPQACTLHPRAAVKVTAIFHKRHS